MDYTKIKGYLTEKRRIHTEAVVETALKLCEVYGEDAEKAELAATFHDLYRGVKTDCINYHVLHLGLEEKYKDNANLAHGKIAAYVMEHNYNIKDQDVLNAVSYHTTGRAGMSLLEKIIYIADAIEPNRVYPGVEKIRDMAFKDIDRACLMSMENTISFVNKTGNYLDIDTIEAKEWFDRVIKEKI